MILCAVLLSLIPFYRVKFPPLVDLPEHILISKLLWEKLYGISHLDLEVSLFLGYRLFPAFMLIVISFCRLFGISFLHLPNIAATALMSFHAIVVVTILCFGVKNKSWKSCVLAVCFSLPAVVCMYSACWFIGFVAYTLAITLLIPAVFLTERFLHSGKLRDAALLFVTLLMVYTAHPFATTFWLLWCFSHTFAAIGMRTFVQEWKRIVSLGLLFAPVFLYHSWATARTALAPSSQTFLSQPPFISINDWYQGRFRGLLNGLFFKADDAANSKCFALVAIGLILFSTILAFRSTQNERVKTTALSSLFFLFFSSLINEKLFPVPTGHWLAYDHRFGSTIYVICLALAGMLLIRFLPVSTDKLRYKIVFVLVAFLSVLASADHLIEVRKAYTRFDVQARKYMAKVFDHEQPTGVTLPHGRYHPDGTYLNNYVCLTEPDCNPPGTSFARGTSNELYPVRLKSTQRLATGPLVGYWRLDEPNQSNQCIDSSGNGNMGTAHGTKVVDGKIKRARSFNGSGDYIDIPSVSISDAITVAAWVYSDNFMQRGFVATKNPVNFQWALFFEAGWLKWRGAGLKNDIRCAAPSNNNWHHIVGKQKGTVASLYVDGILCASGNLPNIGDTGRWFTIGRFASINSYDFTGCIDEVRIYNRALSDTEIAQLFTSTDSQSRSVIPNAQL